MCARSSKLGCCTHPRLPAGLLHEGYAPKLLLLPTGAVPDDELLTASIPCKASADRPYLLQEVLRGPVEMLLLNRGAQGLHLLGERAPRSPGQHSTSRGKRSSSEQPERLCPDSPRPQQGATGAYMCQMRTSVHHCGTVNRSQACPGGVCVD